MAKIEVILTIGNGESFFGSTSKFEAAIPEFDFYGDAKSQQIDDALAVIKEKMLDELQNLELDE